eukprot:m.3378 g.3378  ORF g.3378 m.3378 type:complete len:106 (+) comp9329_c0_seq1:198-515(+)
MTSLLSFKLPELPHMDFEGQKLAEQIFQGVIIFFAVVGFIWGYVCQRFSATVIIVIGGFILSSILTLPPWPFYRRHPIKWRKPKPQDSGTETAKGSSGKGGKDRR